MSWGKTTRPESRRLLLLRLLVLSVFVVAMALTGTAAAEHGDSHDEVLDTEGERFWVGQTVLYEEGEHPNDGGAGSLYSVRDSNGEVISEIEEDDDGHVIIDTRDLGTYQLFSPQGEDLFAFEVGNRFDLTVTDELFTAFRQEPGEVTSRTVAEGLRVSLQSEDGTSAEYNLYGAFLQNGDLIRDGFSSPFTAEAGGDNSVPLDCDSGTEFEPPCSVLGDFLNAEDEETAYSLYVPNKSVFDDASFSSEGPQRFPDSLRDNLQSASQQGPVLFLAPTGATAEARSQFRTQPVVVVPRDVDLGIGWNPIPRQPIVSPSYIEINQAVQNKIAEVPPSGQSTSYGPDSVRILPSKDTVVRYYLTTTDQNAQSFSVGSGPDLRVTVRRGGSVARTFTVSPNTRQSSISVPPNPSSSGAREDLVREMRADTDRTLNYVIPEDQIEKPATTVVMSIELELVQTSSGRLFSEGGEVGTIVCCRSVLGYNAVRVDPPGSTSAPSYSQVGNNVLQYIEKSYPISDLSIDWGFHQWDGNSLKKDLKQTYSGRSSSISGADYTVIQGIRPRPYNVGNAWCPGKISQTGLDGNVAAQEVGHSLDLEHISSTHNTGGFGNEPTPYSHGVIGEFDLSGSSHETAPGKWGNVGAVVQPVRAGNTYEVRVIPAGDPDSSSAFNHVHEFMSYGGSPRGSIFGIRNLFNIQNGNGAWVSDTVYERLYSHININRPSKCSGNDNSITRSTSATGESSSQSIGTAQSGSDEMVDALVFTVTLNRTEKSGQVIRKPMPQSQLQEDEEQEGEYTVEFQNEDDEVLLSRSFDLVDGTGSVQGDERVKKIGQVAVPNSRFDEGIERIVVREPNTEIWLEQEASPSAPEVRVLSPNGGETWDSGTQTIQWEVSDPDGEQPGVLVEYSPDRGESWKPLGFFDPGRLPEDNSIEVDMGELNEGELESSTEGLIRVAATDGVNTAQARSKETFSVVTDDDSDESIDDIQTSLSDTDGDDLPDRVQVDVEVSDVGTGQTTVELGETEFDVDVSQTDTGQAQFVTLQDPDGDGTPESVEFVALGTADTTYTVIADLSNQADGETGTVGVELGGETTDSATYTVEESTVSLDPNNPFGDSGNNPVERGTVIDRIVEWNLNDDIGGTSYTRDEIISFVVEWNLAS